MGAVENAVDAAASFLGPFMSKNGSQPTPATDVRQIVDEALSHLQAIHTADIDTDPNAPYDASLAGVVYGLLDLVALLGMVPQLSPDVTFSERPKSVLHAPLPDLAVIGEDLSTLFDVVRRVMSILEQYGSGIQPLLSQRILPDIIAALAHLSYSPETDERTRSEASRAYEKVLQDVPTSRILPILTTFLQQPLPSWLGPSISQELSLIPLRQQGIRHTVEFLSLSYLSKNSSLPRDASGPHSQIPIPLEAVAQAARLLVLPPIGTSQEEWLRKLQPQLLGLLDGDAGREMTRAAAHIIANGILSKRSTGAPGTIGWDLFAQPILGKISPTVTKETLLRTASSSTLVPETDLMLALRRLSVIASSCSLSSLLKRLIGPRLLPLWALLNYAKARTSLDPEWTSLAQTIITRYMVVVCDAKQIERITSHLLWDGEVECTFGPGSHGGIEIRRRDEKKEMGGMEDILERVGSVTSRIKLLVDLLVDAHVSDEVAGMLFVQITKRWLSPSQHTGASLIDEPEVDPLSALIDAKLSEAFATKFREQFARSPRHIMDLMGQLIENFVHEHSAQVDRLAKLHKPSRATLKTIVKESGYGRLETTSADVGASSEDLISFALSILSTTISSSEFKQEPATMKILDSLLTSFEYLTQEHTRIPISPVVSNAASALVETIRPSPISGLPGHANLGRHNEYRAALKADLSELTDGEPPNRTRALHNIQKLIRDPDAFTIIDVPVVTQMLLLVSLADPESYVHTAAIPVLVDVASRAPNLVVSILTETFVDVDEGSMTLARGRQTEEKERELQHSLDFRLRVGEVLNNFLLNDVFWSGPTKHTAVHYACTVKIAESCLKVASRRGQRQKTLSRRSELADAQRALQEEGEAAWKGPVPNLLEPEGIGAAEEADRDALSKILQGWSDTGNEEDVRIRTSALSVFATILEHHLDLLRQPMIDAALQAVVTILTLEMSEAKAILRRAGILVILGLLRGLDKATDDKEELSVSMSVKEQEQVERVIMWVKSEDGDALSRDHATAVVEGFDALRMKKLYQMREGASRLGRNLGLEATLRGIDLTPTTGQDGMQRKLMVEELE